MKWHDKDENNKTRHRGREVYDEDGSLKRADIYSPSSSDPDYHHHEWLKKKDDGSYEYGHGHHKNH